ncbi:MAG: hypothetical protein Q9167_001205 [Letrouitia subvulpina]
MADLCGCYYYLPDAGTVTRRYLPQVDVSAHATIVNNTSRTVLTQTFLNPRGNSALEECTYIFPLYDGVSVIDFHCKTGSRLINGVVVEKSEAREVYDMAVERGETAGLLDQGPTADVFATTIGNIPADAKVIVKITYVGENKHDMGIDGVRYTIPTNISPRYSGAKFTDYAIGFVRDIFQSSEARKIRITVDIDLVDGSTLRNVSSPSHPIEVSIGNISTCRDRSPEPSRASATLALETCELGKDFVLEIMFHGASPKAILETHPTIPGQRALMVTLVPQLDLPPAKPEIIVVADRSGSMSGQKINTLRKALKIFLKSLPLGLQFNICSFGSGSELLWPQSHHYSQDSLAEALKYVNGFEADFGGTETLAAIEAVITSRNELEELAIVLCTDGDIWSQDDLFRFLNEQVSQSKKPLRVFPLGIGDCVSSSLIEGVARAGNGFAQSVQAKEKLEGKVIRMLKGALTPYISDYTLEIHLRGLSVNETLLERITNADDDSDTILKTELQNDTDRYNDLPLIASPKLLQSPQLIPQLYAFNRTTVYILISPEAHQRSLRSVVLKGTSSGQVVEYAFPVQFAKLVEREAVRLGVQYQIAGKWCSFVVVEGNDASHKLPPALRDIPPGHTLSAGNKRSRFVLAGPHSTATKAPRMCLASISAHMGHHFRHTPLCRGGRGGRGGGGVRTGSIGRGGIRYRGSPSSPRDPERVEAEPLHKIISLQNFDGSWDNNARLLTILAKSESQVNENRLALRPVPSKQVWATALAIAFLESRMAADKDVWELVVKKGRDWIENEQKGGIEGRGQREGISSKGWIEKAKEYLAAS